MVSYSAPASTTRGSEPVWLYLLLGIVFVVAGIVVLGDVVFATIVSTIFIGLCVVFCGIFEIIHAFWTKGWGGFVWQILLGLLYIASGVILVRQPLTGALLLTWVLGIVLAAGGLVRVFLGFRNWVEMGWPLLLSGIFGVIAGFVILSGWPITGLWVIGFLLGIDLIFSGIGWLLFAWRRDSPLNSASMAK
jgi:uncharacterized membrane protein HdeD (DUF308 family)